MWSILFIRAVVQIITSILYPRLWWRNITVHGLYIELKLIVLERNEYILLLHLDNRRSILLLYLSFIRFRIYRGRNRVNDEDIIR